MRFFSTFLAVFLAAGLAFAGDVKIATVDLSKLLKDYPGSQKAMDKLQEIGKKKYKELIPMQDELKDLQNELQNNGAVLSKKDKKEKKDLLEMTYEKFQKAKSQVDIEIQSKEDEMTQQVLSEIKGIVGVVAKDKGYDLVMDTKYTAYAKGSVDLTDEVEKKFTSDKADSK